MQQAKTKNVPKCFSEPDDHVIWLELDTRACRVESGSAGFVCKDCTPEYQKEMMLQERCEHPEVEFGYVSHKFGKHVETEFSGYVVTPRGTRSFNGYIADTTKSKVPA